MDKNEWDDKKYIDEQLQTALYMLKDSHVKDTKVFLEKALKRINKMEANK